MRRLLCLALTSTLGLACLLPAASAAPKEKKSKEKKAAAKETHKRHPKKKVDLPTRGVAVLVPTKGSEVVGVIEVKQTSKGLQFTGTVKRLKPGLHGFHIHEYGDLRDPQGKSAGGHFNPHGKKHGGPGDKSHHAGDLGNIKADRLGVAEVDVVAPWLKLHFILGRSLVVHAEADDLESQPSGDAGPRVAVGVIGVAGKMKKK